MCCCRLCSSAGRATAQLAAKLRYERDTAAEEAGRQHERVRHPEHLLEQERERARAFRQQLVDLLAETTDSSPSDRAAQACAWPAYQVTYTKREPAAGVHRLST